MTGSAHPAVRTAADPRSHADAAVPAALRANRVLALGPAPAGGADTSGHAVDGGAFASVPAAPVAPHLVAVSSSISWSTSALPRAETHSSILTFGVTVGVLAGLPLVPRGAEARVVSDADSRVFARRFARRFGVENEPQRDAARRVRTGGAEPDQHRQSGGEESR